MKEDKTLYKEFLLGNIFAFEDLVIRHKDSLIYFISRYTGGDIYAAEDLAQDVFAYIYVYKEKYNLKNSFKTFIFTLGRNKAIDYVRKQSRLTMMDFGEDKGRLISDQESLEDKIVRDEEKDLLLQSMKLLNPDYRRAIYLADFEELSYQEIGEILGKNQNQVKVLIHRARSRLKDLVRKGAGDNED